MPDTRQTEADATFGMLDHPQLTRQWLLRRLQRALTFDLATAAFRLGLAGTARGSSSTVLATHGQRAKARAESISAAIVQLGSAPYSSLGLSRAAARLGGGVLGLAGEWAWRPLLQRLAHHTLSEYDTLRGFLRGQSDLPLADLNRASAKWMTEIAEEVRWMDANSQPNSGSPRVS